MATTTLDLGDQWLANASAKALAAQQGASLAQLGPRANPVDARRMLVPAPVPRPNVRRHVGMTTAAAIV